jgi:hypothetical protein
MDRGCDNEGLKMEGGKDQQPDAFRLVKYFYITLPIL